MKSKLKIIGALSIVAVLSSISLSASAWPWDDQKKDCTDIKCKKN